MSATKNTVTRRRIWELIALLCAAGGLSALAPDEVAAHFFLEAPPSWREQNMLGNPQKTPPCGDEGTAAETGIVTAFREGETITIRLRETIYHPGHFRVSLATTDRSELPPPPPVTPGSSDCGSVPIMDPPVFPVLVDGALPHTSPLTGEQTIEVTLPAGVTCDHCTLQVVQWMAQHAAPCFYYHCADISISEVVVDAGVPESDASTPAGDASTAMTDAGSSPRDAGTSSSMDGGGSPSAVEGGCGCAVPGGSSRRARGVLALVGLVFALRRRRAA